MIDIERLDLEWETTGVTGVIHIGEQWEEIRKELIAGRKLRNAFHHGCMLVDVERASEEYDKEIGR